MKTYEVFLESPIFETFRCQKACNSLDINIKEKSQHHLKIEADIEEPFNIGLIIGSSGSGKTTLAKKIYGENCFDMQIKENKPIIEQFPKNMTYAECATLLNGVGLNSVPCWVRPVNTLSNGQKARAEISLILANQKKINVVDEWTSVVDRTVAKAMSHCVQKMVRKTNKQIILLSCHYDIIEWLNPCWIIDCNKKEYINRRLLWRDYKRKEKLQFEIREADRATWKMFSKYHYLSSILPGGKLYIYGLYHNETQIGFQCFANYIPHKNKKEKRKYHFNRTVVHPDYLGLGLGIKLINETSNIMKKKGFQIYGKFSSLPVYKAIKKHEDKWLLCNIQTKLKKPTIGAQQFKNAERLKVKTFSFKYIG